MPEMSELTPALFPKGALVELHGLSGRADLNGRRGRIRKYNEKSQRFRLEMMITPFEYVMIKAANLTLVEVEPASDGALIAAIYDHDVAAAKELIASGATVNGSPAAKVRPLYMACSKNAVEIAEALLEAGANPMLPRANGFLPLSALCSVFKEVEVSAAALARPGHGLPSKSTVALVQRLLDAKADPAVIITTEYLDEEDLPPEEHLAILRDQTCVHQMCEIPPPFGPAVLQTLLKAAPALINASKKNGTTPLASAITFDQPVNVAVLLKLNADPNILGTSQASPLHLCAAGALSRNDTNDAQAARLLCGANADINLANPLAHGRTPLYDACASGARQVVDVLCSAGADVNLACNPPTGPHELGRPTDPAPLHVASEKGFESIVERLLQANANANQTMNDGYTPLILAAKYGSAPCVRALLAHGAEADRRGLDGRTALDHAINFNEKECIAALEEALGDLGEVIR